MNTLLDRVVCRKTMLGAIEVEETCMVMTRRIRWLWTRSRTTVLPGPDCDSTPGFFIWWNSDDPAILARVHTGMVRIIERIGFTEPAVWCGAATIARRQTARELVGRLVLDCARRVQTSQRSVGVREVPRVEARVRDANGCAAPSGPLRRQPFRAYAACAV